MRWDLGRPGPSRFPYANRPAASPGLGPGTGQPVRSRLVIIYGPNGGLFVYSGPPAFGNLIESVGIVSVGMDPINQNQVLPGDTRYHSNGLPFGSGGIWVAQQSTQSYIGFLWQTTNPAGPWVNMKTSVGLTNEFTSAPVLALNGNLISLGNGTNTAVKIIVLPSGDTSGVTDVANATFALAAAPSVELIGGQYYGNSRVNVPIGHSVDGPGWETCQWNVVGSDPGFVIQNGAPYSTITAAVRGVLVDGTNALPGAVAAQLGDCIMESSIHARNFTGGNNGILMLNANHFTEQGKFKFRIENCDGGLAFLVSNVGSSSWDRSEFDVEFVQGTAGQEGVVFAAGTASPFLLGAKMNIHGNFKAAGAPGTNAVIKMVGVGTQFIGELNVNVECGGGAIGPQTIFFGDPTCKITDSQGNIDFFEGGGGTFVASNNNGNFWFDGPVLGDATLLTNIALPFNSQIVNSGFPAGWTGKVTFQAPRGDGLIHVDAQLVVANGTVLTVGEVIIASGLQSWVIPKINNKIIVTVSGFSFQLTTAGQLVYIGNATTLTFQAFPYFQMLYANSV